MSVSVVEHLTRGTAGRHPELPETTSGTIRLDLRDDGTTEHWYLTVDRQDVRVDRLAEEADLVVGADREVFDQLAAGRLHPFAAMLRNDLVARGEFKLLMTLRRIFPGPPDARDPGAADGGRTAVR